MNNLFVLSLLLVASAWAAPLIADSQTPAASASSGVAGHEEIPEFFDEDQNIYCLIIGMGIIGLCIIIAVVLYRVKSKSAAFEGSLFQNLEDEE